MNLITLQQAAAWLNIPYVQAEADLVLPGLVAAFSEHFLTLISRQTIFPQTYTERRDGNGNEELGVFNTPIISVSSLTISGITIPESEQYPQPGFFWDENVVKLASGGTGFPWAPFGFHGRFSRGRGNVVIVYTAGYPNQQVSNEAQSVPLNSPYQITLAQASSYQGSPVVQYVAGGILTQVVSNPTTGQYVAAANGILTFSASDEGAALLISYEVSGVPYDIQQCVTEMCGWAYKNKDRIGKNSDTSAQAFTTAYSQQPTSPMAKGCIQRYKNKAVQW